MFKKTVAILMAAMMLMGLNVTAFAASNQGAYSTTFKLDNDPYNRYEEMSNAVFDGADMTYDSEDEITYLTIYTGVYEMEYNNTTVSGWLTSVTLIYNGEEVVLDAVKGTNDTYPTSFTGKFLQDITAGGSFTATVDIYVDNGYSHNEQTGVLTITKK